METRIKILIGILVLFVVIMSIIVGVVIGLKNNQATTTNESTNEVSNEYNQDDVQLNGKITIIYDKVMYVSSHTSESTTISTSSSVVTSNSQMNIKRAIADVKFPTDYQICFPTNADVQFSDDMIMSIADSFEISKNCINTPSMNVDTFVQMMNCGLNGTSVITNEYRNFVTVIYPVDKKISDEKMRSIIRNLNNMLGSKKYVIINVAIYNSSDKFITFLFYIIDTDKIDNNRLIKSEYIDKLGISYNVVYGGYKEALDKYSNLCDKL